MVMEAYSILDVKTGIFYPPVVFQNRDDAIRSIGDELSRGGLMSRHPEDFTCMAIGQFDQSTGRMIPNQNGAVVSFSISSLVKTEK